MPSSPNSRHPHPAAPAKRVVEASQTPRPLGHARRGFTLIEMCIAIAVLGVLSSVALPSFQRLVQRYRWNGLVRELAANIKVAQQEAITSGDRGSGRIRSAGVRFVDRTRYDVFTDVDTDSQNGNETIMRSVDWSRSDRDLSVEFTDPSPFPSTNAIVFRADGTSVRQGSNTNDTIILRNDDLGQKFGVRVSYVGHVNVEPCNPGGSC